MSKAVQIVGRYGISADDYLARAKSRLQENNPEALFYSAFELRCFVEARQDDYLDAQKEYARSIPKAYKVGDQGKALDRIFDSQQIQSFRFVMAGGEHFQGYHVPVTRKLRQEAGWLDNLRHAQLKFRGPDDPWWTVTRKRVLEIYRLVWICAQGNMPSPAFLSNGNSIGDLRLYGDPEELQRLMAAIPVGSRGIMKVNYLKSPPAAWICDL